MGEGTSMKRFLVLAFLLGCGVEESLNFAPLCQEDFECPGAQVCLEQECVDCKIFQAVLGSDPTTSDVCIMDRCESPPTISNCTPWKNPGEGDSP